MKKEENYLEKVPVRGDFGWTTDDEGIVTLEIEKDCVLLGHTDEENYIYNSSSQKFEITEEFEDNILKSFDSFEEMFHYVVEEQIELVQNFVAFNEDEIKDEATDEDF